MGEIIFLTGPVRSGKSRRAVEIATRYGESVVFVATYKPYKTDDEMEARIMRHRAERPQAWRTLEAPENIAAALHDLDPRPSCALIDSLVTWLAFKVGFVRDPMLDDEVILAAWDRELAAFRAASWPVIVISDEVGWSLVPMERELRRFRDLAGLLNQRTVAAAAEAWLMVSGRQVRLK